MNGIDVLRSRLSIAHHAQSDIVGAVVVNETMIASPFVVSELQTKADAVIKARNASSVMPYQVLTFTAVDGNRDVKTHIEAFDVATPADVTNGIYANDNDAQTAATARYTAIANAMAPFCYVALYIKGSRFEEHYQAPERQNLLDTTTTKEVGFFKLAGGLLGFGFVGLLIGKRKKHAV